MTGPLSGCNPIGPRRPGWHIQVRTALACGLVWMVSVPAARAQPQLSVHPTFVLFSAGAVDRTTMMRLSPGATAGYETARGFIFGTYKFDAERYPGHGDLNTLRGRERVLVTARHEMTKAFGVAFEGAYDAYVRVPAQRVKFMPSLRYQITPRTFAQITYLRTDEAVTDGVQADASLGTASIERQLSEKNFISMDYQRGEYFFDYSRLIAAQAEQQRRLAAAADLAPPNPPAQLAPIDWPDAQRTFSHAARIGYTRQIGRYTQLTIAAGPRVTKDPLLGERLAPEGFISVGHELRREGGLIMAGYMRTETNILGLPGIVKADSVHLQVSYPMSRRLVLTVSPTAFRGRRADLESDQYGVTLEGSYMLSPSVYLDIGYAFDTQHGTLDLVPLVDDKYGRTILSVTLTKGWGNSGRPISPPEAR